MRRHERQLGVARAIPGVTLSAIGVGVAALGASQDVAKVAFWGGVLAALGVLVAVLRFFQWDKKL